MNTPHGKAVLTLTSASKSRALTRSTNHYSNIWRLMQAEHGH